MERLGRDASKTELKDMFQFSNDKRSLFDSKSTSIHPLIIQHVYTLKNSTAFMVKNGTRLKDDTLGAGLENASFYNFVNDKLL